jgi:3-phenylpropionate/trans-cinnamate dioxygenase ferredoxin subunit
LSAGFVPVLILDELRVGEQRVVQLAARRILICRTEGAVHAIDWLCPHSFQPLLGAKIANGVIRCPKHGACFELATGKPVNGVTTESVATYPTRLNAGWIEIEVPS